MIKNHNNEYKKQEVTYYGIASNPSAYILLQWLDFFFFILAILILFVLSYRYTININKYTYLLIFLLCSIVFIKPEFIIRMKNIYYNIDTTNESDIKSWKSLINKNFLARFLLILPRLLFFNILYYMFPIFVVLIFLFSILFYIGYTDLHGTSEFAQIMGLIGLTSAFFQYYIKRYEEKIQQKIVSMMSFIQNSIIEECTYKKFEIFVNSNEIYKNLKPEKTTISEVPSNKLYYPQLIKTFIERGKAQIFAPNISLDKFDQNINFKIIEEKKDKQLLLDAYNDFFDNVKKEVKVKIRKKNFLVKELTILLLSNIRFVFETTPEFLQLSSAMEENKTPETYGDFLNNAILEITNEVLTENVLK